MAASFMPGGWFGLDLVEERTGESSKHVPCPMELVEPRTEDLGQATAGSDSKLPQNIVGCKIADDTIR